MTLIFLGGCGAGVLVAGVIFLWTIGGASKAAKAGRVDETKRSLDLLAERNQIQKRIEVDIKTIAQWCEKNWDRNSAQF